MSAYKLLLLDLDGTTVASNRDALPSERVIRAVKEAQKKLQVSIVTGRPKNFAQIVLDTLDIKGPSVFNGGAEVIDISSGELLHQQLLPIDTMREIVKIAIAFGVKIYDDKRQYDLAISDPGQIKEETAKLFIGHIPTKDAIHLVEELGAVDGATAHITTSWGEGDVVDIHIVHEHATKRYGAEKLMNILGIKKEETIAIGDGYNDLPMLEVAGFKVAMGNAPKEIKAVADYVAPTLENNGVAETIERFIS